MTPFRVSIVAALVSFALLLVVLELIRSRRLRERYALLWLLTAVVLLTLSLWRGGLDTIAGLAGISYAPSALFAVAGVFGVAVLLHYSTVISRLSDENAILAQRLALLEADHAAAAAGAGEPRARQVLEAVDAERDDAGAGGATVQDLGAVRRDMQRARRAVGGQRDLD
jgi:hypothetical protein